MRAAVCTEYGAPEVLRVQEVATPVPGDRDALIRIRASSVSSSDCFVRSGGRPFPIVLRIAMRLALGVKRPRRPILGLVLAGEVAGTGAAVQRFRIGDRVYAFTEFRFGGHAEYACVPETAIIASAPRNATDDEAAAIPYGGLLALHYLRRGGIGSGQQVLVYGASGAVGTMAVQLAKHFGARVTAVSGPANLELVQSLGADSVLDYTKDDAPTSRTSFDLVLDAVGKRKSSRSKDACRSALAAGGKYVSVDDGAPRQSTRDLDLLTQLVEAGAIRPVVDRRYPLERISEAHRYVELGHAKGTVVVTVDHEPQRSAI